MFFDLFRYVFIPALVLVVAGAAIGSIATTIIRNRKEVNK